MKEAARRRMERIRHFAFDRGGAFRPCPQVRDRVQESTGIVMPRAVEYGPDVTDLADSAEIHDGNACRDGPDQREIVRDEEVG